MEESATYAAGVTLADVAREADVSVPTASKAVNGREDVAPRTRARVLDAARRLGYHVSDERSVFERTPSRTVGFLTHDRRGRFSFQVLTGIEDEFGPLDATVVLCNTRGDAVRERHQIHSLIENGVDGLILFDESANPRPSVGSLSVPVVYAYAPSPNFDDCSIVTDDREGGRIATNHLIDLGRKKIAVVAGDRSYTAAVDRVLGAGDALRDAGLEMVSGDALFGSWSEQWGSAATRRLFDEYPDIDALVCGSDQIARGAYDALRTLGRSIPEDVSVVGYDNWEAMVSGMKPPLTSVDMNLQKIGEIVASGLRDAISGRPRAGIQVVPPKLSVRGSSEY